MKKWLRNTLIGLGIFAAVVGLAVVYDQVIALKLIEREVEKKLVNVDVLYVELSDDVSPDLFKFGYYMTTYVYIERGYEYEGAYIQVAQFSMMLGWVPMQDVDPITQVVRDATCKYMPYRKSAIYVYVTNFMFEAIREPYNKTMVVLHATMVDHVAKGHTMELDFKTIFRPIWDSELSEEMQAKFNWKEE